MEIEPTEEELNTQTQSLEAEETGAEEAEEVQAEETEETATPEEEETQTETETDEEDPGAAEDKKPNKISAKDRIGQLTKDKHDEKRARERAERDADYWRREAQKQPTETVTKAEPETTRPKPKSTDFEEYDEFTDALTDWKIEEREVVSQAERSKTEQQDKTAQFQEKLEQGYGKYEDFEEVVNAIPISDATAQVLHECDAPAEILYHLGQNPEDARSLARMTPLAVAREIGKIEAKLSGPAPLPQKTTTKAPESTKPVGGKETLTVNPENMSIDEHMKHYGKDDFGP